MVYNTLAHLEKGIDFLFGYVFLVASALCQQWLATFVFCVDFLNKLFNYNFEKLKNYFK